MCEARMRYSCLYCGESFRHLLSLGEQFLTAFPKDGELVRKAPLDLVICESCKLVQSRHVCPSEWLYSWYGYRSGVNASMRAILQDVVDSVTKIAELKKGDTVVDIGSNDGTLLRSYRIDGLRRIGFEPAKNLQQEASEGIERLVPDYFGGDYLDSEPRAKAITAIAMFYDLENPAEFLWDVVRNLHHEGLFVIQMNYLPAMLRRNAFDNISHEHLAYYSLSTLLPLLRDNFLEVLDVEESDVNGGSFRAYCRHRGAKLPCGRKGSGKRVRSMLDAERGAGLSDFSTYLDFSERVEEIGHLTTSAIRTIVAAGKKVYVYGASTRGLVLMQYFGLDSSLISGAAERNPEKWGRFYSGTGIRCVPEDEARREADYFLVLPWQFVDEFQKRESAFLERGGRFIVPLPEFKIIGSGGNSI